MAGRELPHGRLAEGHVVALPSGQVRSIEEQTTYDLHQWLEPRHYSCKTPYVRFTDEGRRIQAPCGKCLDCRRSRARALMVRSAWEIEDCWATGGQVWMITLTFRDECLPKVFHPKTQVSVFLHRLKEYCRRRGNTFRYIGVAEEGTTYGRPHWHVVACFARPFEWPAGFVVNDNCQTSQWWEFGFTHARLVSPEDDPFAVAGYLMWYVFPGITNNRAIKSSPHLFTLPGRRLVLTSGRGGDMWGARGLGKWAARYLEESAASADVPLAITVPRRRGAEVKSVHRMQAPLVDRFRQLALRILSSAGRDIGLSHGDAFKADRPDGLSPHDLARIHALEVGAAEGIAADVARKAREAVWLASPHAPALPVMDGKGLPDAAEYQERRRLREAADASAELGEIARTGQIIGGWSMPSDEELWSEEYRIADAARLWGET